MKLLVARLALSLVLIVSMACGGTAVTPTDPRTDSPTSSPRAPATPSPTEAAEQRFEVSSDGSLVEVRVREQLAVFSAPSDAVLTTTGVTGSFTLRSDGTFAAGSSIVVDLNGLRSDESRRDNFVKTETLDTRRFPNATFVPARVEGVPLPLPAEGEWTLRIVGDLTIRGVTKEVAWEGTARIQGGELAAEARLAVRFGDFGLQQPRVASVLSVVDEIRMEARVRGRLAA